MPNSVNSKRKAMPAMVRISFQTANKMKVKSDKKAKHHRNAPWYPPPYFAVMLNRGETLQATFTCCFIYLFMNNLRDLGLEMLLVGVPTQNDLRKIRPGTAQEKIPLNVFGHGTWPATSPLLCTAFRKCFKTCLQAQKHNLLTRNNRSGAGCVIYQLRVPN